MTERDEPLVAVVCGVPILGEALSAALDGLAECKIIPARQPELGGLLKSLQPDAIVVAIENDGMIRGPTCTIGEILRRGPSAS